MKTHTTGFKNAIKNLGRQLRAVITYGNITLEEEIYAVNPHFEGGILKSIMKQLDLELSVDIPLETVLNCQIGILVNNSYEMLNFGNYVVYKSEKQEDTNTYKLTCYDKILYSMKQNEELNIPYPISIKNYLIAICNKLGLTLETTTFQNESRMIQEELYLGLDYTYRDILDEIAQATGSIICLNENDKVLVKYPTQTNDTIDEEFLKDVNVDFGQMYGAINTIVLSRSGESDNVYYPETLPENPIEIKIKDNQIMNWNDRSDYLQGIYNALNGLYYYINDFSSTGIMYYEVGDLYNVQIGNNTYQCLMLNDEINVTTGIEEIIHTDLPEQSQTDYTKADKIDRRINQTYLIVDKQKQQIESLISTQTEQNQKIARVTQTVDELNSKISDIADITTSLETNSARLEFESVNQSEPIRVVIHPIGVNIAKLHPSSSLKPSSNLKIKTRILRFENTTTDEIFDYEIPDDLLYYDSENYDEFILDYESLTCIINKKCKWNNNGTVELLTNERTDEYTFPHIELTDGDYTVSLIQYNNGYMFVRLMAQNIYTTQFATKAEVNSELRQTVDNINLSVNQRLTGYSTTTEMNSAIDLKANQITSSVSETYATKSELNSSTSSLNSKIDQTASSISLTIDSVQEDVQTAQSTADTATTKADNAQSSANSAQSTANSATTKANNAQTSANNAQATADSINTNLTTNYYTKTQTNSAINQKADSITSTVSQTYSTKTETTKAKNDAISTANANTTEVLKSYSTTTQMNSAINQKANQITSTVSETYSTKTETNTAKNQAISSANASTDQKLQNYSTTTQMNSAITQKANEITSNVAENYATKTTTNSLSTRIKQTAKTIELTTKDNSTSAGITIKLKNEDGTQIDSKSANITLSGLVKFTDLSTSGSTTINGSNITTGTINANLITAGTLSANRLNGGTITGSAINLGNGAFTVDTQGNITATSGVIGGFSVINEYGGRLRSNNKKVGLAASNFEGDPAFWAGSTDPWEDSSWANNMPFYVTGQGYMKATNANISGTITATSGTFDNCTIRSNCTVAGKSISTSSSNRINSLYVSSLYTEGIQSTYSVEIANSNGAYMIGDWTGQNFQLVVNDGEKGWRRLTFKGGILVNVESSW